MPLPRGTPPGGDGYAQAAVQAGAAAIVVERVVPYSASVSQGVSFGIGGFGYGGGGGGAGVGISAPIGGGQVTTGYAADTHLTEAASGRLLWTTKASSPPSANVQTQIQELARAIFSSADELGVL